MKNFFYPLTYEDDNISPLNVESTDKSTKATQTQKEINKEYSLLFNIPFFNTLFYPNLMKQNSFKTLFYYQTFSTLKPIINLKKKTKSDIYVYISSIHFTTINNKPLLYINDNPYSEQITLWNDAINAHENEVNILLMIGGAGGAFTELFSKFDEYYNLLYILLNEKRYIKGIDLDIEEPVKLDNIKMLITRLKKDFGYDFIITVAPVSSSMAYDMPGMGNFIYKDLYNSPEEELINWYNVQSYEEYSYNVYNSIIQNGYTPDKIVFGMLGDNYNSETMESANSELIKIKNTYPNMAGCILWEYGDTNINPIEWAIQL